MDLLSSLLTASGGGPLRQLAQNFGLSEEQAASAVSALVPALGQGLARNTAQPGGLQDLLAALSSNQHQRYLEQPELLSQQETVQDGNGILGHILGSKEVSRAVANRASTQTGLSSDLLKQMLPVIATLAMGVLSRQNSSAGVQDPQGGEAGGLMGSLSQFLDSNRDGSVIDDIMGFGSRFFGK